MLSSFLQCLVSTLEEDDARDVAQQVSRSRRDAFRYVLSSSFTLNYFVDDWQIVWQ